MRDAPGEQEARAARRLVRLLQLRVAADFAQLEAASGAAGGAGGARVLIALRVVPGSRKTQIVGRYASPGGARLKVKVSAPPEDGRANEAVCAELARALGTAARDVTIVSGHTRPEKTALVVGVALETILAMW